MRLHIGGNVGFLLLVFLLLATSFFLPRVTDANRTYVSSFSDENYSEYSPLYSSQEAQSESSPTIIHRRRAEEKEQSISSSSKSMKSQGPNDNNAVHEEATTGLLNFRAAFIPDHLKKSIDAVTDDYMLSLDVLLPQIPTGYDVHVIQDVDNGFNSNYHSLTRTETSVVKETDIGLQFNTRKLRTIEIKIIFEEDVHESVVPEQPLEDDPAVEQYASPVMSQTTIPEVKSSAAQLCHEQVEIKPILEDINSITTDRITSSLFRRDISSP